MADCTHGTVTLNTGVDRWISIAVGEHTRRFDIAEQVAGMCSTERFYIVCQRTTCPAWFGQQALNFTVYIAGCCVQSWSPAVYVCTAMLSHM